MFMADPTPETMRYAPLLCLLIALAGCDAGPSPGDVYEHRVEGDRVVVVETGLLGDLIAAHPELGDYRGLDCCFEEAYVAVASGIGRPPYHALSLDRLQKEYRRME